jgi:hypothetical protein
MPSRNSQVEQLVSKLVAELETVFRQQALHSVQQSIQAALGGALSGAAASVALAAVAKRGPGRPRKAASGGGAAPARRAGGGKGGRIRRSTAEIEQTAHRILDHIKRNPGQRAEQIKKALNLRTNQWALPIGRLLEKKQIRTKGEKRATTYSAG